jgi:PAS domain S-box-containing protein
VWDSNNSLEYSTDLTATNFAVVGRGTENTMELSVQQQDDALPKLTSPTDGLDRQTDLDRIISALPNGFATFDRQWQYTYANNRLLEIFKLPRAEVLGKKAWEVFPHQVGIQFFDLLNRAMTERAEAQFEFYYEIADCWVEHRVYPTADGLAILMADISDRKQAEFLLLEQQQLLELTASGAPLAECLVAVCASVSKLSADVRACFLLADSQRQTFNDCIAPVFPASWCEGLWGTPIDELTNGTCGTAVYCGRSVTCTDIASDDVWSQPWRDLCLAHRVLACHSAPIVNADDVPLGSLMLCFDRLREPTAWECQLADFGTHIARIVFERDRSNLASRESAAEYQNLFESIDEGFCVVEMIFDAQEQPVDYRFEQANPAFVRMTGLPADVLGKTARQMVPDLEQFWVETYGNVVLTGESVRFENKSEPMNRWFDVYASRVGDAASRRVAIVFNNITERKQAEKISQLAAKFDAFRITLADALRPVADPVEIQATASRVLGEHLGANRVAYFEVRGAIYVVERDYLNGGTSLVGNYPVDSFGSQVLMALRSGRVVSESDVATDLSLSPAERAAYAAIEIVAYLCVPLVKDGEFVAGLVIHTSKPRVWTLDEVAIAEEVAERTWAALERAHAEAVVAANLRDTRLLRDLGARLVTEDDPQTIYRKILATAIALTSADAGTMQILDDRSQDLLLLDTQGFDRQMIEYFDRVNASSNTSCGLALRHGERTFVDFDVPEREDPDGTMRLHVAAGYRSAQSTPLFSRTGRLLGMVSTHWRSHHRSNDCELRSLDLLARQAADSIEQQQTTAALRESEAQLRLASEAAKVGMWFWNLETDSLVWTEQCKSLFGFPAETEMSYAVFLAAIHPDDRQHTDAAVTRSIDEHTDYDIEYRCCWSDGSVHWIAAKGSCTYDPIGKPIWMMGVAIDINNLKQAQIELQQSSAILNTINQATPTLIFVKDRQGRVRMGNPALMRVLGKPESEVLGYTDAEFYPNPDDATAIMATDRQVMETGQTQVVEETLDLPDGRRTFLSTKSPYVDETGTIVGLVGVAFDISLRKQMEAALADRNQELDSFVYIVSHDLKAPLRAISNLSVWIEEDLGTDLPAEIGQHMTQLRERVRRMEAMINGLLGYARVGRTDVQTELVSVAELLAEILDSLMPPSTFEITIAADLPTFPTKRLLLSQVFSNLIGNAFKHHDKSNGFIRISCQEQGDFYEFTIVDDGPGIASEQHDRVFVIFQSTNPQKNPDSTGIGLSIVKKIVETAGGKIWLESELGKGTTFYFTWPK